MIVVTAPNEVHSLEDHANISLFLAGGITNCPDWQTEMLARLEASHVSRRLTVYNPRRQDFDIKNPKASEEQVVWEFERLMAADVISFWFAPGSVNPIVFYELGMWGNSRADQPMVVGCDPEFTRVQDVVIQTQLARPGLEVFKTFDHMITGLIMVLDDVRRG